MSNKKKFNRRTVLAAIGAAGVTPSIASAEDSDSAPDRKVDELHKNPITYDALVINQTKDPITVTARFVHRQSGKGPEFTFELDSQYNSDGPSHYKEFNGLPKRGGNFDVEISVNDNDIVSGTLKLDKSREFEAALVLIDSSKVLITTETI